MPDMQIILTNELSKIAAQTSLSLEGLVSSMRNSGMSNEAIKQTLVNDLTSGGRLFGNFKNQIKNTVKNGVEMSGNNGSMGTFENAGVEEYQWVSVGDKSVCIDCEERHKATGTKQYFETIGMPKSGFSICQQNCRCQVLPSDYKGENLDKPLLKKDLKPTDFNIAGNHKTVKDSLARIEKNISQKVSLRIIKNVDALNCVTVALSSVYKKYNLKGLEHVKAGRSKKALASANYSGISINQRRFTKDHLSQVYKVSVSEYGKDWKEYLKRTEKELKLATAKSSASDIRFWKREKRKAEVRLKEISIYKRHNTFTSSNTKQIAKEIILHELGHVIQDQYTGMINGPRAMMNPISKEKRLLWNNEWRIIYKQSKNKGLVGRISEYAAVNKDELFAESFAMYAGKERNKLPKLIKDYLDRYLKEFGGA